jgi:quinoprotein glucose dehydrogenase
LWSFALKHKGAGFEMDDVHEFISNELFIDQVFGYDGKLYTLSAATFADQQLIHTVYDEEHVNDPIVTEVGELFRGGFDSLNDDRLAELLGHKDQRVRREAQFELVARQRADLLAAAANNAEASLLMRIHGLWGLGQMGSAGLDATGWQNLAWLESRDDELTAQVLKLLAQVGEARFVTEVRALLKHDNGRVRYFAAMAIAKTGDRKAVPDLIVQLRANADSDPWLRHALVFALGEIADTDALMSWADDDNRSVRMGVLLALRRQASAGISHFLHDGDAALVVEAARAIHDLPIDEALPALSALGHGDLALRSDEEQSSYALHRRIINASLRLGSEQAAIELAAYAADERNPENMRELALASLRDFATPPAYDRVFNVYRPLPERSPDVVYAALDAWLPKLMGGADCRFQRGGIDAY